MSPETVWLLFSLTGAPELYLLYCALTETEASLRSAWHIENPTHGEV